ncbi:hypothetical protein FPV16_20325 [Methylobacterium sp. W2]|nr:hypothetical protein [Methylobacterium sp. W2]
MSTMPPWHILGLTSTPKRCYEAGIERLKKPCVYRALGAVAANPPLSAIQPEKPLFSDVPKGNSDFVAVRWYTRGSGNVASLAPSEDRCFLVPQADPEGPHGARGQA